MSHLDVMKIQDLAIKIEPIGVLRSPSAGIIWPNTCPSHPCHQGPSVPVTTNCNSTETNYKPVHYKVFERISGVISAEFLALLPGNPLQIFECIVSEYGDRLNVTITGNYKSSTLEILLHGENLWTLLELEQKLNAMINHDDQTACEDSIDSEVIQEESSKSHSVFAEQEVMYVDRASPKATCEGREMNIPEIHVCETTKVETQHKSTTALENEEILEEMQQDSKVMYLYVDTQTGILNTDNQAEYILKDANNDFNKQESLDDYEDADYEDADDMHVVKKLPRRNSNSKRKQCAPEQQLTRSKQTRLRQHTGLQIKQTKQLKTYMCSACSFRTDNFRLHVKHRAVHKRPALMLKCPHCDYTTAGTWNISRHKATHSSQRFTCDMCPYEAPSESMVLTHKSLKHKIDKNGEKYLECPVCPRTYTPKFYKLFYSHLQTHPDLKDSDIMRDTEALIKAKRHVCEVCGYQSRYKSDIDHHRSVVHSDNRPCLCEECGKAFKCKKSLKNHRLCHVEGGRPKMAEMPIKFNCNQCSYRCKTLKMLRRHRKGHDEKKSKIYKCPDCDFSSLSHIHLSQHMIVHCKDRFYCDYCSFQTHQLITLKSHIRKKHKKKRDPKDIKYFSCPSCHFKIGDRHSKMFMSHLKTHPELKDSDIMQELEVIRCEATYRIKCHLCQFKAQTFAELTIHKNSEHAGIKSHHCDDCSASYKHRGDLRKHRILKHPDIYGLQAYTCNICDKKCPTETLFKKHEASHSQDAKVFCDICKAGFPNKFQCLKHMGVSHKIGTPCLHCDKMFSTKQGLNMHMRKIHVNISETQFDETSEVNPEGCESLEVSSDLGIGIPVEEGPVVELYS